jgi:hypothetical protein
MASPKNSSGRDEDLTIDDVKLDDLTLDDDSLFADLDNEVRLEGGEEGLSLDLKDDDLKLDFDVEAVGTPAKAAPTNAAPGKSTPARAAPSPPASTGAATAKGGSGKNAAPADDLELDDTKLGSVESAIFCARPIPDSSMPPHQTGIRFSRQRSWMRFAEVWPPTRPILILMMRQALSEMAVRASW